MIVGVPKETFVNERRVALIPPHLAVVAKLGLEVMMEAGAGWFADFECVLDYEHMRLTLEKDESESESTMRSTSY